MPSWGLTAGLAGISQGLPQGITESKSLIQNYEAGLDQASQIAFGRTLQMLGAGGQQQPQMQGPPPGMQGGQSGMPPPPPPQMGAPQPQGAPPMGAPQGGGVPPATFGQRFSGAPMGGLPATPMPPGGGGAPPQMQPPPQGGQPPMQPGGQQQGGPLDWRQIFQAVSQANPGAPPQVIAGAVNRAIPLMNSQSQLEWRQVQAQMAQNRVGAQVYGIDTRADTAAAGQAATMATRLAQINTQREGLGLPPLSEKDLAGGAAPKGEGQQFSPDFDKSGGMGGQQAAAPKGGAEAIAGQMVSGKAPPITTGMYRLSGPVRSILAQKYPDFNLAQAQLEWKKAERMTQGLTSPQQVRFQQLGTSVVNTMDMAMEQAKKLQLSGITPLNKAKLDALISLRGNSPIGQEAAKYVQTVAFLKGEVANLENGGYAPTESSWAQARNVINENYGVEEFLATMPNAQRLINYRLHAQQQVPEGMSQGTRYKVPQGTEAPQQGAPQSGDVHDGYRFKGGDPSKKENWEKTSEGQGKIKLAGDVVPIPASNIKGPTFRRGTSGKPIPLTPENIDRVYGTQDKGEG